ncbi:MAG: radical SAM protein [Nitrospira sp.]|nr:radical SAM protein [Nitrospira sp.]
MPHPLLMPQKRNQLHSAEELIEERIEGAGEAFLVPFLDGHLFYSPLANISMILNDFGASTLRRYFHKEELSTKEQSLIDNLTERNVFQIQQSRQSEGLFAHASSRWAPTSATFSTTQKCTLRCKYCYAEGGRLEDLDIPWPIAKAAIDLIVKNAKDQRKNPSIGFLGEGEATANWSEFKNIIEYFKEQCSLNGFRSTISLSTNGVFAESRLDYIAENCTSVTFSVDGLREVHDENRVLPNGGGSFDRIIAIMKGLEVRGKPYNIRSTVTVAGSATLTEFVQFVGNTLQCKSLHFEPVFDVTGVTNLKGQIEHLDAQSFVDNFRKARQVAAGFGIELYFSGSDLKHRETFCGAGNAMNFLVTSRGIVTSCNEVLQPSDPRAELFQYGGWNQSLGEFVVNRTAIDRLGGLNVHEMPKCQGCIAKYNCAGDCYAKNASLNGDPTSVGYTERCHITRELLKDNLLIQLISEMVGIKESGETVHHCLS